MRRAALAAPLLLGALLAGAPAAQAADFGMFTCDAPLNLAAGTGVTYCEGTVTGVVDGTVVIDEEMYATVEYNETGCPLLATATGEVYIDDDYYADFDATQLGTHFSAILSGGHAGSAQGEVTFDPDDVGPGLCSDTNVTVTLTGTFATQ